MTYQINNELVHGMVYRIAQELVGIAIDDLTKAERNIVNLLVKNGFVDIKSDFIWFGDY